MLNVISLAKADRRRCWKSLPDTESWAQILRRFARVACSIILKHARPTHAVWVSIPGNLALLIDRSCVCPRQAVAMEAAAQRPKPEDATARHFRYVHRTDQRCIAGSSGRDCQREIPPIAEGELKFCNSDGVKLNAIHRLDFRLYIKWVPKQH